MKNPVKLPVLVLTSALLFTSVAMGQTNSPQQTFMQSFIAYFSTINTNFNFEGAKLEMSTGVRNIIGVPPANYLIFQYDIKKFNLEAEFDNAGIAGTLVQAKAGIGYTLLQKYDTKLQASLVGGWDFDRTQNSSSGKGVGVVEPRLMLRKKATANTYWETGLGWPIWFEKEVNTTPSVFVGGGFTY